MKISSNMGSADRIIRVIVALLLLALSLTHVLTGVVATIAIILAVVFLLTSVVSFCPLYLPFHISTKRS